jgi:hypothetical protein
LCKKNQRKVTKEDLEKLKVIFNLCFKLRWAMITNEGNKHIIEPFIKDVPESMLEHDL